ncbi:MAG: hypothetical protein LUH05_10195, partial [Candidatus Gastranaerophilales bacterium]|nr:hypothetical protein [Candidatus Gastranaerophilales bacterium]
MMTVNIQDYTTENILKGYIINDSLYEGFYIIFKDAPAGIVEYCNYIGRSYTEIKFNLSQKTLFEYFLRTDHNYKSCENNQFLLNNCEIEDYIGFIPEDDCDFYEILFEPKEPVLKELQRESTDNGCKNLGLDCFDYVFTLVFKIPDKKIHIQF